MRPRRRFGIARRFASARIRAARPRYFDFGHSASLISDIRRHFLHARAVANAFRDVVSVDGRNRSKKARAFSSRLKSRAVERCDVATAPTAAHADATPRRALDRRDDARDDVRDARDARERRARRRGRAATRARTRGRTATTAGDARARRRRPRARGDGDAIGADARERGRRGVEAAAAARGRGDRGRGRGGRVRASDEPFI